MCDGSEQERLVQPVTPRYQLTFFSSRGSYVTIPFSFIDMGITLLPAQLFHYFFCKNNVAQQTTHNNAQHNTYCIIQRQQWSESATLNDR
jgi:hypothetical protein